MNSVLPLPLQVILTSVAIIATVILFRSLGGKKMVTKGSFLFSILLAIGLNAIFIFGAGIKTEADIQQETRQAEENLATLRSAVDGDLLVCFIPRTIANKKPEVAYAGFVWSNTPDEIVVTVLVERDRSLVFQPSTFLVEALSRSDCVFQIVRGETLLKQMTR